MTAPLLTSLSGLPAAVRRPDYDRMAHGAGIVHIGLGAFHRAHQAVATDDALAATGGDWRIIGANLRSRDVADAMTAQNGLYTVLSRAEDTQARVIGAHATTIGGDAAAILRAACDPKIKIVSLTISEKGYGIDRVALDIDLNHPAIAADLADPMRPTGAIGIITAALAERRAAGRRPFTVMSCDNLPDNGALLQAGVVGFARRANSDLADWITDNVAFPLTMVDRITPATTDKTHADVMRLTGHRDEACVETEPFSQWVIEDHFSDGRPQWEAGGTQFVSDVRPYEMMKLRMLNGAHSLLAYSGQLLGLEFVRDTVADTQLAALIRRHMIAAGATLPVGAGLDVEAYQAALMTRFTNPSIAHQTHQIAMDGTEKLPQRWFAPAVDALARGQDTAPFAFATATWCAWVIDLSRKGETPNDPRGKHLQEAAMAGTDGLLDLPGLLPPELRGHEGFRSAVRDRVTRIHTMGMRSAMAKELQS